MKRYPKCTIICQKCDTFMKTTLEHMTIKCSGCGDELQVRSKGDNELIEKYNAPAAGETPVAKKKEVRVEPKKAGATGIARSYYQSVHEDFKAGKISRKEILAHVIEKLGVNSGTAGVQWSKFIREN